MKKAAILGIILGLIFLASFIEFSSIMEIGTGKVITNEAGYITVNFENSKSVVLNENVFAPELIKVGNTVQVIYCKGKLSGHVYVYKAFYVCDKSWWEQKRIIPNKFL